MNTPTWKRPKLAGWRGPISGCGSACSICLRRQREKTEAQRRAVMHARGPLPSSLVYRHFAAAMHGRSYGVEETADARAWFTLGWDARGNRR